MAPTSHFWYVDHMNTVRPIGRLHSDAMRERAAKSPAYRAALEELMPYDRIARKIVRLRMDQDFSQEELARRVGTSPSAIARLESGQHRPSVETLRRVAKAFDRTLVVEFAPLDTAG